MSDHDNTSVGAAVGGLALTLAVGYLSNYLYLRWWVRPEVKKQIAAFEESHSEVFAK